MNRYRVEWLILPGTFRLCAEYDAPDPQTAKRLFLMDVHGISWRLMVNDYIPSAEDLIVREVPPATE